jgi:hypothetical protein
VGGDRSGTIEECVVQVTHHVDFLRHGIEAAVDLDPVVHHRIEVDFSDVTAVFQMQ